MKIKAGVREFNIFLLFCHDNDAVDVMPFSQYVLEKRLNAVAEELFPGQMINFISPDDSGLSQWVVHYKVDRYSTSQRCQAYPTTRVWTEKDVRKNMPTSLVEVLEIIGDREIEL